MGHHGDTYRQFYLPDQIERDFSSQRWLTFRQALGAGGIQRVVTALADLVRINVEHNAALEKVMGRPADWKDSYLNEARAALALIKGESR